MIARKERRHRRRTRRIDLHRADTVRRLGGSERLPWQLLNTSHSREKRLAVNAQIEGSPFTSDAARTGRFSAGQSNAFMQYAIGGSQLLARATVVPFSPPMHPLVAVTVSGGQLSPDAAQKIRDFPKAQAFGTFHNIGTDHGTMFPTNVGVVDWPRSAFRERTTRGMIERLRKRAA